MDEKTNGWAEWGKYVLKELERLNLCDEKVEELLTALRMDFAIFKAKAFSFGSIGGFIAGIIASLIANFIFRALAK